MPIWKVLFLDAVAGMFRMVRVLTAPLFRLVMRAVYLSGLRAECRFPVPASTQFDGPVRLVGTGRLKLGEYCRLGREVQFETNGEAEIVIGDRVRINAGTVLTAHAGITIGDDTLIGEYVSIRDANHGVTAGELIRSQAHVQARIQVGQDVWIGRGCCILKGVTIGDGAIVGANSVVTRDITPGTVCAGIPAVHLKNRSDVMRKMSWD